MGNWQELMDSGLLELYVLGQVDTEEALFIEKMAVAHTQVKREIEEISLALERYAQAHAIEPDPIVKPFLMATIDFSDRMKSGEKPELAPILDSNATAGDYIRWLERPDMNLPIDFEDVFAKILSYTPEAITAIVWIKHMAPQEVHDHESERFLILEGTCDIYVEDQINHLKPGDYFQIPCKVILQRVAA